MPAVLAAIAVLLSAFGRWQLLFGFVAAFMAFFFRDPKRQPPSDPDVVVAPADGRVTRVSRVQPRARRFANAGQYFPVAV